MSLLEPTVTVDVVRGHQAVRMLWQRDVDIEDVAIAFREVEEHLNSAQAPVHVVLDLLNCTRFPLLASIEHALAGPAVHENMGTWVVIGSSQLARVFAKTLITMTGRTNVYYLDDDERWLDRLEQLFDGVAAVEPLTG